LTRNGLSHGCATLVSIVAAGLLVQHARGLLPPLTRLVDRLSLIVIDGLRLPYSVETVTAILIAAVLAGVWGAAFALITGQARRGKG
jgi:hypothetical protein